MAVVITSDEASRFAPSMRRSQSQPKFPSKQSGFRQSSSASRISDLYQQPSQNRRGQPQSKENIVPATETEAYQQLPVFSDSSATSSSASSPRTSAADDARMAANSPSKLLVPSLRLPQRLDRPGYGSSPNGTDDGNDADVAIAYPHYDGVSYFNPAKDFESPPSLRAMGDDAVSPHDNNTLSSTGPSSTNSDFDIFEHVAEDDTAVRTLPSRHVDYLSHNWKEEDIWESWKYIVSRRGDYTNSARLENASWRTWMKSKNKLKTISPETLNWLKDCDVTWLYGPLQTGHAPLVTGQTADSVELTKSNSFLSSNKKTILKKRSMSELMLQRSLSASSLLKQAAAAVQAQQKDPRARKASRPRFERAATDYMAFPFSSNRFHSTGLPSMLPSTSSSDVASPSVERKHIHFNEQVEQCIAVDIKGEGDDEDDDEADPAARYNYDSDSDDGAIMMKRTTSKHRMLPKRRHTYMPHMESKTIAMLPSTTLKYREDAPDSPSSGSAMKHSYRSPTVLSPSSSQETLRPSKMSGRLLFGADGAGNNDEDSIEVEGIEEVMQQPVQQQQADDDNASDSDSDDGFGMSMGGARKRTGGLVASASTSRLAGSMASMASSAQSTSGGSGGLGGLKRTTSTNSLAAEPSGMRRTASGMFMPYEQGEPAEGRDEPENANGGLVGRVIDTVNTARDIIYVIWNVGWRK